MQWAVKMGWHQTLVLHWKVDPDTIRQALPRNLDPDFHGGFGWIGLVVFEMTRVRHRWLPILPGMHAYPEINVRTYSKKREKHGIYFFSLDTPEPLTRMGGSRRYHLPYRKRQIRFQKESAHQVSVQSYRADEQLDLDVRYCGTGQPPEDKNADLIAWTSERYHLFSVNPTGDLFHGEVHHPEWPVESVTFSLSCNRLLQRFGIIHQPADLAHYSRGVDTFAAPLKAIRD